MGSIFMYSSGTVPYRIALDYNDYDKDYQERLRLHQGVYKDNNSKVSLKISETQKNRSYPSHPHFRGGRSNISKSKFANLVFGLNKKYFLL